MVPLDWQRFGWIGEYWQTVLMIGAMFVGIMVFVELGELGRGRVRLRPQPGWPSRKARGILLAVIAVSAFVTAFTVDSELVGFVVVTVVAIVASVIAVAFRR